MNATLLVSPMLSRREQEEMVERRRKQSRFALIIRTKPV
jgi:hypothetical protein